MTHTIRAGKHFSFAIPWLIFGKTITRTVKFGESCRYDLGTSDQLDWNKLFGIGFWPGKHTLSYRISWRYNPQTDLVEIAAYWYKNKVRHSYLFASVTIGREVEMRIQRQNQYVEFKLSTGESHTIAGEWQFLGWRLNPYFGGNRTPDHDIKIEIR